MRTPGIRTSFRGSPCGLKLQLGFQESHNFKPQLGFQFMDSRSGLKFRLRVSSLGSGFELR